MEVSLFSSSLSPFDGTLENQQLVETVRRLTEIAKDPVSLLCWDDWRIAVPLQLSVDIPPLGTFENIDIRDTEPVVFVYDLREYPHTAPMVFTDRLDFPKDKLAHLYIAKKGRPPAFCYVRGDRDTWYANKRVDDLLIRIQNWLRDAADGSLVRDGNQFEPLRLENYSGSVIYDYDQIADIVAEDKSLIPNEHFAMGLFELSGNGFRLVRILERNNVAALGELVKEDQERSADDPDRKHYRWGYFLWTVEEKTYSTYEVDLPDNWGSFKEFCSRYGVASEGFEKWFTNVDRRYIMAPIVVAIKRPKPIIGYSANIEFMNFRLSVTKSTEVVESKISDSATVKLSSHNQPLTIRKAREVSGIQQIPECSSVVFGCGALGSKIVMHIARSGLTNMILVDPDNIAPHNMVRHALLTNAQGRNKSLALSQEISRMYPVDKANIQDCDMPELLFGEGRHFLDEADWVFDFTASEAFFSRLVTTADLSKPAVKTGYISDFGNLGILFSEGQDRNPRIDDLRAFLYARYVEIPEIEDWLRRERYSVQVQNNITVSVGVGCNSETTVLSDEKVATHAAIMAGSIKAGFATTRHTSGKILLSIFDQSLEYGVRTLPLTVEPLDTFSAINDPSWSLRFLPRIIEKVTVEVISAGQNETGGVFVGVVNYKTKTIHVTDLIPAPPDSEANSVCFLRGYHGLAESVKDTEERSGGQLGYVGEWHSHPHGPNGPSQTDMDSVHRFKKEFDSLLSPIPVFMTIVTPTGILPYVF